MVRKRLLGDIPREGLAVTVGYRVSNVPLDEVVIHTYSDLLGTFGVARDLIIRASELDAESARSWETRYRWPFFLSAKGIRSCGNPIQRVQGSSTLDQLFVPLTSLSK